MEEPGGTPRTETESTTKLSMSRLLTVSAGLLVVVVLCSGIITGLVSSANAYVHRPSHLTLVVKPTDLSLKYKRDYSVKSDDRYGIPSYTLTKPSLVRNQASNRGEQAGNLYVSISAYPSSTYTNKGKQEFYKQYEELFDKINQTKKDYSSPGDVEVQKSTQQIDGHEAYVLQSVQKASYKPNGSLEKELYIWTDSYAYSIKISIFSVDDASVKEMDDLIQSIKFGARND